MIESFSRSLGEFYLACANGNSSAVELISKTLIETFAIIIMGDDAINLESKLIELEKNISNNLKAEAQVCGLARLANLENLARQYKLGIWVLAGEE